MDIALGLLTVLAMTLLPLLGWVAVTYWESVRLFEWPSRKPEVAQPEPDMFAVWDEIIDAHTSDRVIKELPASIVESFTPAGLPCPKRPAGRDEHVWSDRMTVRVRSGQYAAVSWRCIECGTITAKRELAEEQIMRHRVTALVREAERGYIDLPHWMR